VIQSPLHRASLEQALLLVVDIQGILYETTAFKATLDRSLPNLIRAAQALKIPVRHTEQYPKGLGKTLPFVAGLLTHPPFEKTAFGCFDEHGFFDWLQAGHEKRDHLIVCGIESHICVWNTVCGAIQAGYRVSVVEDAISARTEAAHQTAVARMRHAGAAIVTREQVIYELLRRAGTAEFKAVLPVIKELA
jgi:isochorismate hydrolase